MVEKVADDGQCLFALNEVFVGHPSHQSAHYRITDAGGAIEWQLSSGIRGRHRDRIDGLVPVPLVGPPECLGPPTSRGPDAGLVRAREAWPSPATGTAPAEGVLAAGEHLTVTAETDGLVVFGDGIETDRLVLSWGQSITVSRAHRQLQLLK